MGISKLSSKMPKANWLYPCGSVNRCWSTFCGKDAVSLPVTQTAEAVHHTDGRHQWDQ